jgi:hypothetical protein
MQTLRKLPKISPKAKKAAMKAMLVALAIR